MVVKVRFAMVMVVDRWWWYSGESFGIEIVVCRKTPLLRDCNAEIEAVIAGLLITCRDPLRPQFRCYL